MRRRTGYPRPEGVGGGTIHLLHELRRRRARFGLGSACIAGGKGVAVVVEAFHR